MVSGCLVLAERTVELVLADGEGGIAERALW